MKKCAENTQTKTYPKFKIEFSPFFEEHKLVPFEGREREVEFYYFEKRHGKTDAVWIIWAALCMDSKMYELLDTNFLNL